MSDLPRVNVINLGGDWLRTGIYINNQKINYIKAVDFHVAMDEVPKFTFETIGVPDIDMTGDIRFSFMPKTVTEAVTVLRNELLKHGDLYDGFLTSMRSAIEDAEKWHMNDWLETNYDKRKEDLDRLAECMLKRIAGEE